MNGTEELGYTTAMRFMLNAKIPHNPLERLGNEAYKLGVAKALEDIKGHPPEEVNQTRVKLLSGIIKQNGRKKMAKSSRKKELASAVEELRNKKTDSEEVSRKAGEAIAAADQALAENKAKPNLKAVKDEDVKPDNPYNVRKFKADEFAKGTAGAEGKCSYGRHCDHADAILMADGARGPVATCAKHALPWLPNGVPSHLKRYLKETVDA